MSKLQVAGFSPRLRAVLQLIFDVVELPFDSLLAGSHEPCIKDDGEKNGAERYDDIIHGRTRPVSDSRFPLQLLR